MHFLDELKQRELIHDISDEKGIRDLGAGKTFYIGFDPTAPSLTVGNLVPIIVLCHLARAGLKPIVLFGGATGSIGDPSGKSAERKLLAREDIDRNVTSHSKLISEILARAGVAATYVNNFDWTQNVSVLDFLREVGKHFTVNYMVAKELVRTRMEGDGLSYTEFSYMLLQSFDYLHLYKTAECRLQIGGSDQWGNITAGLELIRKNIQGEAYAFSFPLITNSEGKKFGKSEAGAVWISADHTSPYQFHQFWLNVPDADVIRYLKIYTFLSMEEISGLEVALRQAPEKREAQTALADALCTFVHGPEATKEAKLGAHVLFGGSLDGVSEKQLLEIFSEVPSTEFPRAAVGTLSVIDLFAQSGLIKSKGEARRLIESGGAYLHGERIADGSILIKDTPAFSRSVFLLRSGKKNYHVIKVSE